MTKSKDNPKKQRKRSQPDPAPPPEILEPPREVIQAPPEVTHRPLPEVVARPGLLWPEKEPMPTYYRKPRALPCPSCRRVRLDCGGQACVTQRVGVGLAYLRCRQCSHRWSLPVED